jgi:hypothetical protein
VRKGDRGESAGGGGGGSVRRDNTAGGGGTRRNSEDVVMVEQPAAREHQAPYFSGFLARYRSSLQEGRSLADGAEDSSGYWRFDVEGSVEVRPFCGSPHRHHPKKYCRTARTVCLIFEIAL